MSLNLMSTNIVRSRKMDTFKSIVPDIDFCLLKWLIHQSRYNTQKHLLLYVCPTSTQTIWYDGLPFLVFSYGTENSESEFEPTEHSNSKAGACHWFWGGTGSIMRVLRWFLLILRFYSFTDTAKDTCNFGAVWWAWTNCTVLHKW